MTRPRKERLAIAWASALFGVIGYCFLLAVAWKLAVAVFMIRWAEGLADYNRRTP